MNIDKYKLLNLSSDRIIIPRKVRKVIDYLSIEKLIEINKDINIAKEILLVFLSNFSYTTLKNPDKNLNSVILKNTYGSRRVKANGKYYIYPKIIKLLEEGTPLKGEIISMYKDYSSGHFAKSYALSERYIDKGIEEYVLSSSKARKIQERANKGRLLKLEGNSIVDNLLNVYPLIKLPSIEELKTKGKQLIKDGYTNKKGKLLVFDNPDDNQISVTDHINRFKSLTTDGYILPSISKVNAGGRVTDTFTLMPSWIRGMCKIGGEKMVELDFRALHPNIAISLYSDNIFDKMLSHNDVADYLNINVNIAKKEHLSFFNATVWQMQNSPVYSFYESNFPDMLDNIITEKRKGFGKDKHKRTSRKLFKKEVEIMTDVLEQINKQGVFAIYVYDALYVRESDALFVKLLMNRIILEHKVYSEVG